ncbi:hypothetical protein NC652_032290 [Populus alba x Populus x berolinensis]|nr:hypothetical protein NC652_032290 [Populus alba x Populus x berolinensis]
MECRTITNRSLQRDRNHSPYEKVKSKYNQFGAENIHYTLGKEQQWIRAILPIFPFPSSSTLVPLSPLSHFYLYPASTNYVHSYAVNRKGTEVHYTKRSIKLEQEKKKTENLKTKKKYQRVR